MNFSIRATMHRLLTPQHEVVERLEHLSRPSVNHFFCHRESRTRPALEPPVALYRIVRFRGSMVLSPDDQVSVSFVCLGKP